MRKYLRVTIEDNKCYGELVKTDNGEIMLNMFEEDGTPLTTQPIGKKEHLLEYMTHWKEREQEGEMRVEPLLDEFNQE